jgi:hypothetical protein
VRASEGKGVSLSLEEALEACREKVQEGLEERGMVHEEVRAAGQGEFRDAQQLCFFHQSVRSVWSSSVPRVSRLFQSCKPWADRSLTGAIASVFLRDYLPSGRCVGRVRRVSRLPRGRARCPKRGKAPPYPPRSSTPGVTNTFFFPHSPETERRRASLKRFLSLEEAVVAIVEEKPGDPEALAQKLKQKVRGESLMRVY